jgi:FSR family fosmidomycin resistance protein-like MFS transporter
VRTIVITEVATGLGILLTLALPGIGVLLLLPLLGVALQGTSSVLYATIGDLVDKDRLPRAFGLFYTIGSLCGIAAPLGYGLIGDTEGVQTTIAAIGCAVLLAVPLAAMLRPAVSSTKPVSV